MSYSKIRKFDSVSESTVEKNSEVKNINLNNVYPECREEKRPSDYNNFTKGNISVIFRDLETEFIKLIPDYDAVVGCVAWLTNYKIMDSLASSCIPCSIIVQKEDFLRPDSNARNIDNWKSVLNGKYNSLISFDWHSCDASGDFITGMNDHQYSTGLDDCVITSAVRCVGNHNSNKEPAFPRMHNKFIVFLKRTSDCRDGPSSTSGIIDESGVYGVEFKTPNGSVHKIYGPDSELDYFKSNEFKPMAVWTGSFNFTMNGTNSLENAVIIKDEDIALQYAKEWYHIVGLSEKLDWESEWVCPEVRVGT